TQPTVTGSSINDCSYDVQFLHGLWNCCQRASSKRVHHHPGCVPFRPFSTPTAAPGQGLEEAEFIGSCKCLGSPLTGLSIDPRLTDISSIDPAKALRPQFDFFIEYQRAHGLLGPLAEG